MAEEVQRKVFTLPNFITGIGLIGIAAYMVFFLTGTHTFWIPGLIFFIALSDALDGWAARKFNRHSYLGKVIDPLRDRLMALAIFLNILLVADGSLSVYGFMVLIVLFELGIGAVNYSRNKRVQDGGKVHLAGKLRMLVHTAAGGIFVLKTYWVDILESTPLSWILKFGTFELIHIMFIASFAAFWVYIALSYDDDSTKAPGSSN